MINRQDTHDDTPARPPRLDRPDRSQADPNPKTIDELIPEDHPARMVWELVQDLDMAPLYDTIKAVEGHPGRPAIDPPILVALWIWVYATVEGIASARRLARLCYPDHAVKWLRSGVDVNYSNCKRRTETTDEKDGEERGGRHCKGPPFDATSASSARTCPSLRSRTQPLVTSAFICVICGSCSRTAYSLSNVTPEPRRDYTPTIFPQPQERWNKGHPRGWRMLTDPAARCTPHRCGRCGSGGKLL